MAGSPARPFRGWVHKIKSQFRTTPPTGARGRAGAILSMAALATLAVANPLRAADGDLGPRPATRPAGPGVRPPTTQVTLSFKDAPLDAVLDYLSEAAGFVIVKDAPVDGRVTLVSRQAVTADEAVVLLNTVLKSNGFTAIQQGRVVKIVARDKAKKQNIPVHFGGNPKDIEATDELITQVIPVSNVDAVKLKADLAPLLGTDADVTANGGSNAIVLTDTSSNIRRVVEIISALDQHESGNFELKRYILKNANATAATKLIIGIFKPEELKPQQPNVPPKQQQNAQEQALRGKINAVADERTNTIYITGAPETLTLIDGILKELDANPASVSAIKIFPLKYADAASAVKLLTTVFKGDEAKPRNPEAPPPRPGTADQALGAHVTVAADERTNSLVVAAPTETLSAIEDIIKKLDSDPSSISELKVIPLVNSDATAMAKLIMSLFKPEDGKPPNPNQPPQPKKDADPLSARVNAVADDRTNSVVVTAPSETLKAVVDVIKILDANAAAASTIKSFPLKYADATAAGKLVTTIFQPPDNTPQPTAQVQYVVRLPGVPELVSKVKITVAADDRTNTLIVSAPNESMRVIEGILKDLDSNPASESTIFIYRLKNGQAANLEPVLNSVFGNSASGSGVGGNQRGNRNNSQSAFGGANGNGGTNSFGGGGGGGSRNGIGGGGGRNRGVNQNTSANRGAVTTGGATPTGGGLGGLGANLSPSAQRLASELAGQVSFVAEPDTNSLVVNTSIKFQDRVKAIIDELDRPVPQVLIKVLIAEVTHDNSEDLGVDFSVLNKNGAGRGVTVGSTLGAAAAASSGGLVVSLVERDLSATLRAIATAGKLDVLSRPYILASDNQEASITVGQEVPFITDTRTDALGQQINSIQYQDIGIILDVTPHINPQGLVIMDVYPEISQLTGTTVPISSNVSAPVFAKRSAQSRVAIQDGQTIVIGGLMQDNKTSTLTKVPFLGDIPGLGLLFQRRQITKTKTELLIFITPHVALQPDALQSMSREEMKGTQLTPNAVTPGTFDDHLRGLQRGSGDVGTLPPTTKPVEIPPPSTQP